MPNGRQMARALQGSHLHRVRRSRLGAFGDGIDWFEVRRVRVDMLNMYPMQGVCEASSMVVYGTYPDVSCVPSEAIRDQEMRRTSPRISVPRRREVCRSAGSVGTRSLRDSCETPRYRPGD